MMERQRYIIDFTVASLMRQQGKNAALLAVYTLVVFVVASILLLTSALKHEADLALKDAPEIIVQRTLAGRYHPVPLDWAGRLAGINGVLSVAPRLWGYHYDPQLRANYTLLVPTGDPPPSGSIDVGAGVAKARGAHPGDIIVFTGHDGEARSLTVRNLLSETSQLLTADLVLLSEEDYRDLSGLGSDAATDLALRVRNQKEYATIAAKISRIFPDSRPILRSEILRTYEAVFGWRSALLMVVFSAAALAFMILAWDKASGLSAEQRREIGILKAVGWETSDVMLMKFWEGMIVSLAAFLLGLIFAYVHVFFTSASLFAPVLKGWSTLYPAFRLAPHLDFGQIGTLFFLTVVPYTAATVVPSWRAAVIDPDEVMR